MNWSLLSVGFVVWFVIAGITRDMRDEIILRKDITLGEILLYLPLLIVASPFLLINLTSKIKILQWKPFDRK